MAQEVENKKTTLDDDASIYQKRNEDESVQEKWSKLNKAGKFDFFKDYFLKPIIVIGIIVLLAVYMLFVSGGFNGEIVYDITTASPFYLDSSKAEEHLNGLVDLWGLNKKKIVRFDTDITLSDSNDAKILQTYLMAGSVDVIIGTVDELSLYGEFFDDITKYESFSKAPEKAAVTIEYMSSKEGSKETEKVSKCCGLYIKDTVFADSLSSLLRVDPDKLVVVFIMNGDGNKAGKRDEFFKFLLNL